MFPFVALTLLSMVGSGSSWDYNSNTKVVVLMRSLSLRMREMVDGLRASPANFAEWEQIKALFRENRPGFDVAIDEDGKPMDEKEMSKTRTKLVRQIARRSGYLIKEENLFKKVKYGTELFRRLFTDVELGKNPDGTTFVKNARIKDRELLAKWKAYNAYQVWVLLWNLFAAVAESKINADSQKFSQIQLTVKANLVYVANALTSYFDAVDDSEFKGWSPWNLDVKTVMFKSQLEYQRKWGLLSFPSAVIKALSGEMEDERRRYVGAYSETDGLVDGLFSRQPTHLRDHQAPFDFFGGPPSAPSMHAKGNSNPPNGNGRHLAEVRDGILAHQQVYPAHNGAYHRPAHMLMEHQQPLQSNENHQVPKNAQSGGLGLGTLAKWGLGGLAVGGLAAAAATNPQVQRAATDLARAVQNGDASDWLRKISAKAMDLATGGKQGIGQQFDWVGGYSPLVADNGEGGRNQLAEER